MMINKPSTIAPRSAFVVPALGCSLGSIAGSGEGFGIGYAATTRERHVDAVLATPGTHAWRPPIT
ncbi:MAG TPA: hypothetical protein VFL69_03025 [Marmoricola sp.]|nr:hypothetical protein [Marmoricola sp.]